MLTGHRLGRIVCLESRRIIPRIKPTHAQRVRISCTDFTADPNEAGVCLLGDAKQPDILDRVDQVRRPFDRATKGSAYLSATRRYSRVSRKALGARRGH